MASANEKETRNGEIIRRGAYPEMTWPAVIVGWFLGSVIAVSISYAALILGFSIEGSELAAILGWGILRGLMGRTSIIENNINQTVASSVNGASSGIMFSVPALLILSQRPGLESVANFDIALMIFSCIAGAFIGLAFVIPLRKQMIDFQRLPYPSGIAVATILKSPGAGMKKAGLLLAASVFSAAVYLWITNLGANDDHDIYLGQTYGLPSMLNLTLYGSLMTVGVGFLSGRGGFWFGAGGFICYWMLAPIMSMYAANDVKTLIDPTVRQSVVSDNDLFRKSFETLASNPDLVTRLSTATGIPVTGLPISEESKGPQEPKPAKTFGQLLASSVTLAPVLNEAIQAIETDWRSQNPEEVKAFTDRAASDPNFEMPELLAPLSKKLSKHAGLKTLDQATQTLAGLDPAIAETIRSESNAKNLMDFIKSQSSLSDDARASLLSASAASKNYNGVPGKLNKKLFKPTGIGMLIGAALGGILLAFPLILSAIGSMRRSAADRSSGSAADDEMPIWMLFMAVIGGMGVLIFLAYSSVDNMSIGLAVLMAVLGTLWIWIAGVIVAECIGRTNWSPLSGMTLIAVTILIVIAQAGLDKPGTILASLVVGAAICLAISQASDMMLDLKSGYLVGATPKKQQIAQFIGAWLGPIIVIFLMLALHKTKGIGTDELPAPQAQALASVIEGIVNKDVPVYRYLAGGTLGFMLAASGLGGIGVLVALGFYMPFNIVLTYSIGCLLRIIVNKFAGNRFSEEVGIPLAAGLIVGEALIGVGIAVFKVFIVG
ncbi:MAG: OPT/YSL family transporter [Mariniblastus sp.]